MKYKVQLEHPAFPGWVDGYIDPEVGDLIGRWINSDEPTALFDTYDLAKAKVIADEYIEEYYRIVPESTPEQRGVSHE